MFNFTKPNDMYASAANFAAVNSARSFNVAIFMGISLLVSIFVAFSGVIIILPIIIASLLMGLITVLLIAEESYLPYVERTGLI